MKAIRVHENGGPKVLKYEEVPDLVADDGQVLVRLKAVGINPVDTYIRSGAYGAMVTSYTPGMDGAGVVEAVGKGVYSVKPGDRIYTAGTITGSYAEQTLCCENQVYPLADSLSFEQGAAIYVPYATAWRALFHKAKAVAGESVLIHGASGGVGMAALQIAKWKGLRATATAGTDGGMQLIHQQGVEAIYNHKSDGYLDRAWEEQSGKQGFNIILEMLANVNLDRDLDVIARGGRIVVIGNRGRVEIDPRKTMRNEASVLGMTLMNASPEELQSIHMELKRGFLGGQLVPVVGKSFPLKDAAAGHEAVMQPGAHGKIVLIP